jgi:signal peptidase I
MDSDSKRKLRLIFKDISTVVSWTVFALLIVCAAFLVFYYVSVQIYAKKGAGYEPMISLYTIISPSMVPNINVYDVVVDKKIDNPSQIKVNDIITFNSDEFTGQTISVTHRVVEIVVDENGVYKFSTKGDNNFVKDPSTITFDHITGKVIFKIPQLGRVQFFLASKAGWLIAVVIPALYVIIKDIFKIIKISGIKEKHKNSKLFMPIRKKRLMLPLKGYTDENGVYKKATFKDLFPFTFDNNENDLPKSKNINTQDVPLSEIYKELDEIEKQNKN